MPSVDIYQIDANGIPAKLDTIVSSPAGVYGPHAYTTSNMAAIFWQFTSSPPASTNPPPASVTFINDSPTVPLSELYNGARPQTPFAPADSTLILNLDLRRGTPPGWSNSGSGTFDATNGYVPGTGSANGLVNTAVSAFSSAAQLPQGTVAVRFQRAGVATDDSLGSRFWDSAGNSQNATTQSRQLFQMRSNSRNWTMQALVQAETIPFFLVRLRTNSMSNANYFSWQTVNSHYVPGYQDSVFADLVITWYQNQYYIFFDGHLVSAGTLGDVPIYEMFQNICIGNFNGTGSPSGSPFGDYYVQQLQISSRFLGPVLAGPTIGLIPDSFAAAYTQRATPIATGVGATYQISDIDAVQNALGLYTGIAALTTQPGQTATFHQIQALMFEKYGFFPPIYNAGQPGHGYSHINAPIDDAFIAALNRASPSIVMAGGTINDVSPFTPSDANIVADTEGVMNRLSLGGGTRISAPANPLLEQIIYLETLSSQAMPNSGPYPAPAYATESQNIIAATRAGLSGFAPVNSVGFNYVASREWWDHAVAYPSFFYGSNPVNPYNLSGGVDYLNGHPDATGYSVIAAHLYGPIATAIMQTAGANLFFTGVGTENETGLASYSLLISNAGPLSATGTVVSGSLPVGAAFVASAGSTACALKGQALTCNLGTIAAGASYPLNIQLQGSPSTQIAMSFSVGSPSANGGTGIGLIVSSGIAVPNVAGNSQAVASAAPIKASLARSSAKGGGGALDIASIGALAVGLLRRRWPRSVRITFAPQNRPDRCG